MLPLIWIQNLNSPLLAKARYCTIMLLIVIQQKQSVQDSLERSSRRVQSAFAARDVSSVYQFFFICHL